MDVDDIPPDEKSKSSDLATDSETANSKTWMDDGLECTICYSYLRDPIVTQCGHRFCSECISEWLKTRTTCPTDNCPLTEHDIYPDNYTKRVIANIPLVCENEGCNITVSVSEFAEHYKNCEFRSKEIEKRECPYNRVNCDFKTSVPSELLSHHKNYYLIHLQLLLEESKRLATSFENCRSEYMHNESCSDSEANCKEKLPFYMNDVYQKLTELDQRTTEHCIRLNRVNTHLEKCIYELNYTKVATRETCNGLFIWEITNLEKLKAQMMSNQNFNIYSSPFSSSERGYRFQLRLTSAAKNSDGLKLLIHVVKGIYDPILKWPFFGKVVFRIINQVDPKEKLEAIIDCKSSAAFQRAQADINLTGYGLPVTMTISDLKNRGFAFQDKLIIVVSVKSYHDNDFVIDLGPDDDLSSFKRDRKSL